MRFVNKMDINDVWFSKDPKIWEEALKDYRRRIESDNKSQIEVENKFEKIEAADVQAMSVKDFCNLICEDYFLWKFGTQYLDSKQNSFCGLYFASKGLDDIQTIKDELFSFNVADIKRGLEIVTQIRELSIKGGSGFLAVLFPDHFATIDKYIIRSLKHIAMLPEQDRIVYIKEDRVTLKDGVFLIELMRRKAAELNLLFNTDKWRPRDIDMILWAFRIK